MKILKRIIFQFSVIIFLINSNAFSKTAPESFADLAKSAKDSGAVLENALLFIKKIITENWNIILFKIFIVPWYTKLL